jgi:hypothetical protein
LPLPFKITYQMRMAAGLDRLGQEIDDFALHVIHFVELL